MSGLKEYDVIAIGSGSAMTVVNAMLERDPLQKAAVIEKDEPGGICLTRGCIPSKLLLYPAELLRTLEHAERFGIEFRPPKVEFGTVMERMRGIISADIEGIRRGLSSAPNLDYYPVAAEFIEHHVLRVGSETITSKLILLCTGSRPLIPHLSGLESAGYLTSDTALHLTRLPKSLIVMGGGYIGAEMGHFFAAMGSEVTIVGRNPQFLPEEEPMVSEVALKVLGRHMAIRLNCEAISVKKTLTGGKRLTVMDRGDGSESTIEAAELLVACGRTSNTDLLHPERTGVRTDSNGWIEVNEYLETSAPGIWAMGDATGRFPFKHKANYDARLVYDNAVLGEHRLADYHAVPHAVFTYPEIASVGQREQEATAQLGPDRVLVGTYRYEDTAKGQAMDVHDYFVKVVVEKGSERILGAHIVGPYASLLIQEIVSLMYSPGQSAAAIREGMHIHPALSEVVERAFLGLRPAAGHPTHDHPIAT